MPGFITAREILSPKDTEKKKRSLRKCFEEFLSSNCQPSSRIFQQTNVPAFGKFNAFEKLNQKM